MGSLLLHTQHRPFLCETQGAFDLFRTTCACSFLAQSEHSLASAFELLLMESVDAGILPLAKHLFNGFPQACKDFFFQVGVNFFEVGVGDVKSECVNRSMRSGKACGDHCKSA